MLAQASGKPGLPWTFVVLDTDAVNAFAAPGGYVHITRGALALMQNEAELAGVLGHELIHVTEKHTIRAIQKSKSIQMGADETLSGSAALLNQLTERVYLDIVNNSFGRAEENESDEKGVALANKVGYAPQALGTFLTRLQERNKDAKEKRGLFASHPEMKERLERLAKQIQNQQAHVHGDRRSPLSRSRSPSSRCRSPPSRWSRQAPPDSPAAAARSPPRKRKTKRRRKSRKRKSPRSAAFGLGRMLPTGGGEQKSTQVSASGGARGVDPERDAKGGSNPKPVPVKIVAADLAAFKKEGGLP